MVWKQSLTMTDRAIEAFMGDIQASGLYGTGLYPAIKVHWCFLFVFNRGEKKRKTELESNQVSAEPC